MRRDTKNALIGGVCAGIAKSLGMPILVVRLLFLFAILWAGAPLIVYPILWLLMPKDDPAFLDNLKLERDEKNGLICGVCAGLANSLGINVTVLRILWVIAVLYMGFGLLPYIILWILMPKKQS